MMKIYQGIVQALVKKQQLLAILIDPEKIAILEIPDFIHKVQASKITHILVGGSTGTQEQTASLVSLLKKLSDLPIILFPGNYSQITQKADGLLLLSLLSGRNPEFLIDQHIKAAPLLINSSLEIIPTGYLLIDGGIETSVQKVSATKPIAQNDVALIKNTAFAGELLGKQLIYLEAGSGAKTPVSAKVITAVKESIQVPLIVGGGIRTKIQLRQAYAAGADLVVIGNAFEQNASFFNEITDE